MDDKTRLGIYVLGAAVVLGLLADLLLRATPWGVNISIWSAVLMAAVLMQVALGKTTLPTEGRWLLLAAFFYATAAAWRDSLTLKLLDTLALLAELSLAAVCVRGWRIRFSGVMEYVWQFILLAFDVVFGPFTLVLSDIQWREMPRSAWTRRTTAAVRGLILVLPLLLVFGGLFMAADAFFEGIVKETLRLNFDELVLHLLFWIFFAWIIGGFLRGMFFGKATTMRVSRPKFLSLGVVEIGVILGLLDALFLSFVIVQIRYFFGGAALVAGSAGLTYADYARRGFFELVTVSTLSLPLLLVLHWLLRKEGQWDQWVFRVLAGVQILLLFVIMASAVQRMLLYQSEYGLTELRLYTTAFMAWLGIVFLWFVATVLREQRHRFAFGALVAGFLIIAALHFLNPDSVIIRANITRAQAGRNFDAEYATSLSADGLPALITGLPGLSKQDQRIVSTHILQRYAKLEKTDWRIWNWGRAQARAQLQENRSDLLRMAYR
jgi:hypothetical protein